MTAWVLALLLAACAADDERHPGPPPASPASPPAPVTRVDPDAGVAWHRWGAAAFQAAADSGRPVLLYVSRPGCDGLFAEDLPRWQAQTRFVPVRVDPERRPDVARRYAPAGCPSMSVLLSDGAEAVRATGIPPANVATLLSRLHEHLQKRPEVVEGKVERGAMVEAGVALRVADVLADAQATYDPVHGGFGGAARFPEPAVLRFLQVLGRRPGGAEAGRMVRRSLDALIASPLRQGGFLAYSHTPDWDTPRRELSGAVQAGLLRVLAGAAGSASDRRAGQELFDFVATRMFDADRGAFRTRLWAPPPTRAWWTDPLIYADDNALLIRAFLEVGEGLGRAETADRQARAAGRALLGLVEADGAVRHDDGADAVAGLLRDQMLASLALGGLARRFDDPALATAAARVRAWADEHLWDEDHGAYADASGDDAPPAWTPRFVYADDTRPAGNALAAAAWTAAGDTARARRLLAGPHLTAAATRAHASAALVQLELEAAP